VQQISFTVKGDRFVKFFPKDFTPAQREERIFKALEMYCRKLERARQEQERER